jgi:MFS transporter, FLVCR family, MFS-domain-containing protein 7
MSLIVIKSLCPIIGLCYLAFIWVPGIRTPLAPFFVAALLGGASFSLVPITLEYLVDITHPIAPESTSSLCLVAGFLLSIWFTVIMKVIAFRSASDSSHGMTK